MIGTMPSLTERNKRITEKLDFSKIKLKGKSKIVMVLAPDARVAQELRDAAYDDPEDWHYKLLDFMQFSNMFVLTFIDPKPGFAKGYLTWGNSISISFLTQDQSKNRDIIAKEICVEITRAYRWFEINLLKVFTESDFYKDNLNKGTL